MELNGVERRSLLCEASTVYEENGMSGFQSWARRRENTSEERAYLDKLETFLLKRNGVASTRVYAFTADLVLEAMRLKLSDTREKEAR